MTVPSLVDVCVIGAGLAGLRAATLLADRGLKVAVLEARDRVGGRTEGGQLCGEAVDIGGQWLGPTQTRALALCRELGLETYPQYAEGLRLAEVAGRLSRYRGVVPRLSLVGLLDADRAIRRLNRAARDIDLAAPWQGAAAAALDRITLDEWLRRTLFTRDGRRMLDIMVRAIMTCEAHEISVLSVLCYIAGAGSLEIQAEVHGDGAQKLKIKGGAFQLSERLAARLPQGVLALKSPVRAVEQSAAGVTVHHAGGTLSADRAVLALAPPLAAGIEFSPALPPARLQLQSRMMMGSVIKALVAYERPFWREQGWSGEVISDRGPFGPVMDATPPGSARGFLVGFFDGGHSRAFSGLPAEARRAAAVASLQRYFGPQAASPIGYIDKDWIADPWSLGGYAGITGPGTLTNAGAALRDPCGRVHWAGTETAVHWPGYMDGAIASAERVAAEVASAMA